jgi:hypothetical protein
MQVRKGGSPPLKFHHHSTSKNKFKVHNINHSVSLAPFKLIKLQVRKGGSPPLKDA